MHGDRTIRRDYLWSASRRLRLGACGIWNGDNGDGHLALCHITVRRRVPCGDMLSRITGTNATQDLACDRSKARPSLYRAWIVWRTARHIAAVATRHPNPET